eukprot:COSAG06_NODE_2482_length_6793_cov_10.570511_6_plen_164_part_00
MPATTPPRSFSPSVSSQAPQIGTPLGADLSAFVTEHVTAQLADQRGQDQQMRMEMETLREEAVEAKLQAVRAEAETKLQLQLQAAERAISDAKLHEQQLGALQSRLERLLASKLLTEEETFAIEDIIADESPEDDRVTALISLSSKMTVDGGFARQLRRKYVA